jgi:hypothetical protein
MTLADRLTFGDREHVALHSFETLVEAEAWMRDDARRVQ